jgi:hypothetical protein
MPPHGQFSITVHLYNKSDNFSWFFSTIYGPVLSNLKRAFWLELAEIGIWGLFGTQWNNKKLE